MDDLTRYYELMSAVRLIWKHNNPEFDLIDSHYLEEQIILCNN